MRWSEGPLLARLALLGGLHEGITEARRLIRLLHTVVHLHHLLVPRGGALRELARLLALTTIHLTSRGTLAVLAGHVPSSHLFLLYVLEIAGSIYLPPLALHLLPSAHRIPYAR